MTNRLNTIIFLSKKSNTFKYELLTKNIKYY